VHGDANVLIRPTMTGDLNLDGDVSISDFIDLASHFNELNGVTWQEGDLNYDDSVTISDFIDLAANFNTSYAPVAAEPAGLQGTTVPEPGAMALFVSGVALAARRRVTRCKPSSVAR